MNLFFQKKKKKIVSSNEKKQPIHMRYHFFVHHEWFLQNLGKEAVRTNMHRTVSKNLIMKQANIPIKTWKVQEELGQGLAGVLSCTLIEI